DRYALRPRTLALHGVPLRRAGWPGQRSISSGADVPLCALRRHLPERALISYRCRPGNRTRPASWKALPTMARPRRADRACGAAVLGVPFRHASSSCTAARGPARRRRAGGALMETCNPFPGPKPYRASDQERFFGREQLAARLVDDVLANRCVTVYGPS